MKKIKDKKIILFVSPFGKKWVNFNFYDSNKKKIEKAEVDFDKEYSILKKKLEKKDVCVTRVDENFNSLISEKMFKMIHAADVVVADMTGLNPNVAYELGIRHSLREKTTILIKKFKNEIIPFDFKDINIYTYDEFKKNNKEILVNNRDDSPVLKSISKDVQEDRKIFKDFEDKWTKFINEINKVQDSNNWNKKKKILSKYSKHFKGMESFDQRLAALEYQENPTDINKLKKAWGILVMHLNTSLKPSPETLGLLCSISRKLFELTNHKIWKMKSFKLSRLFLSQFVNVYSISAYAMHLVAVMEKEEACLEYLKYESKLLESLLGDVKTEEYEEYYDYTLALVKALRNKKSTLFDGDCNTYACKTSKKAYERVLELYNVNKKRREK